MPLPRQMSVCLPHDLHLMGGLGCWYSLDIVISHLWMSVRTSVYVCDGDLTDPNDISLGREGESESYSERGRRRDSFVYRVSACKHRPLIEIPPQDKDSWRWTDIVEQCMWMAQSSDRVLKC